MDQGRNTRNKESWQKLRKRVGASANWTRFNLGSPVPAEDRSENQEPGLKPSSQAAQMPWGQLWRLQPSTERVALRAQSIPHKERELQNISESHLLLRKNFTMNYQSCFSIGSYLRGWRGKRGKGDDKSRPKLTFEFEISEKLIIYVWLGLSLYTWPGLYKSKTQEIKRKLTDTFLQMRKHSCKGWEELKKQFPLGYYKRPQ